MTHRELAEALSGAFPQAKHSGAVVKDSGCELRCTECEGVLILRGERLRAELHGDPPPESRRAADALVFHDLQSMAALCVVEMKGRSLDAGNVLEQLSHSAVDAEKALCRIGASTAGVRFNTIVLSRADMPELQVLSRRSVRFAGRSYDILLGKCGSELTEILPKDRKRRRRKRRR
ncbi:MAG: hypothetical protein GF320_22200 [Armatimonadia bacterium]|nr:hypothetical protein [Armatimonadia bacterium]